jgi:hypothetical protein
MEKVGIENIVEVVEFGFEVLSTGKDVFGKGLDLSKLPMHLVPLYQKAIPAFEHIGDVVPELKDLDKDEAEKLIALVASKGVANEKVQEIIKQSIDCALSVYKLVKAIQA